jgi:hypothetical protein
LYASGGRVDISGSLFLNGVAVTVGGGASTLQAVTTAGNQTSQSISITGSLNTTAGVYITPTWRIITSASNLVVEKFDGSTWLQSGIFN